MIGGNTKGIRTATLAALEHLYDFSHEPDTFVLPELLEEMARYSSELNREISVFLSRAGRVLDVTVGDHDSVSLPFLRKRRGLLGLSGVRCIHTHPSGSSHLSAVDRGTLLSSRLDAMAAVSVSDGTPKSLCAGVIGGALDQIAEFGPFYAYSIPQGMLMEEIQNATTRVAGFIRLKEVAGQRERALLVGLNATEASMHELALLAETAGAEVVSVHTQTRPRDNAYYIGKGKARELALRASAFDADLAICNDELSVIESRNLEEMLGLKVIDRTALILDIFAGQARTHEGRLQVELAQLKYNLPRLAGTGTALSRLGGGIGTRGPGEKKIETDRRRIRRRIFELEREIDRLEAQRALRRSAREKSAVRTVALVGYTNAGKSSLLNALADAGVYVEDKLFATLDPVTRRVAFPDGGEALFTDTVGFIEKLPHDLVSAFRSTLEEAARADLLLNVIDCADEQAGQKTRVVLDVLADLGAGDTPILNVYNKVDRLTSVPPDTDNAIFVSARTGQGLDALLTAVKDRLLPRTVTCTIRLGYAEGARLAKIKKYALEWQLDCQEDFMEVRAVLPAREASRLLKDRAT